MVALELLERVAEGRTAGIGARSEVQVGLAPGELQTKGFNDHPVRVCALRKIGETGLPEAVDYLTKFTQPDFAADSTQQLWPAVQIALADARLRGIANPRTRIEFLERTVAEQSRGAVAGWAANELCDRGVQSALPVIEQSIRKSWSGQYGEDEIDFCRARMQTVSRDPDRIKALGSVLSVSQGSNNQRLTLWAVHQLYALKSPRADAELERYINELGKLPEDSLREPGFWLPREEIRNLLKARRSK